MERITFTHEDTETGRKATLEIVNAVTWPEQADLFMDFLRAQSYVIGYDVLGTYFTKGWNDRIDAEAASKDSEVKAGLTD